MNYEQIQAHLEAHDELLKKVEELVPKSVTNCYKRECTLDSIAYEEGGFVARYSVYVGCGDYEEETKYFSPYDLFKDAQ